MIHRTTVATDGGCDPNPGLGAWAVVSEDKSGFSGAEDGTTNNEMELTAILVAVEEYPGPLMVKSDSQYAINVITGQWRAKANTDLVKQIQDAVSDHGDVEFIWVKGHADDQLNKAADQLCTDSIALYRAEGHDEPVEWAYEAGAVPDGRTGDNEFTTLAKAIKELADEGMTYGIAYRVLGGAGLFDASSRTPSATAIDSDFARDTGKVYNGKKFYIWNREVLLETLTALRQ